ncbi:SpoIIE family protein phosphatase, partial [bacterium]|nr:SpoIIE family protein phosphatase [bacterium]
LNDFLVEREIPDLLLSITYGVFDPGNSVISYATGGHEARLLKSRGKCHSKNTGGIPLGVFPSRNFQQQDLILVSGDLFVIVSRSFLHQSSERTWLQRDEALNHWLVSQGEQLLKPHANALPPRPGNQASPLSLLCLGKSGARA